MLSGIVPVDLYIVYLRPYSAVAAAQNEGFTVPVTFMAMTPVPGPPSDIQNARSASAKRNSESSVP